MRPVRPRIGEVVAEADALGEPRRAVPRPRPAPRSSGRRPRRRRRGRRACRGRRRRAMARTGPPAAQVDALDRHAAPDVAPASVASASSAGSSAERSKPTAGGPPASAPYVSRTTAPPGVSSRIAGIGRATRASAGLRDADPPQGLDRDRRAEHAAGPPAPGRLSLEDGDVDAGARESGRERATRQPAPDDRDIDPRGPGSSARSRGRAPPALRPPARPSPPAPPDARAARRPRRLAPAGPRPRSATVSSATVYARRTDSGAS